MDALTQMIDSASAAYHRLVVVVGPAGSGKTRLLEALAECAGYRLLRVGVELSELLLSLDERQRALMAQRLLAERIDATGGQVVLLDNIELLFDVSLKLDPLRCLQANARNRTIVAAWNGRLNGDKLAYATPDHAEYRQYDCKDVLTVAVGSREAAPWLTTGENRKA